MKMSNKKKADVARRAWNMVRFAILWARKRGVLKRRLLTDLSLLPKFVKSLTATTATGDGNRRRNGYGERQMSFDKTPVFPAIKFNGGSSVRFLNIPCLNTPVVDFDYEFDHHNEYDDNKDVVYDYDGNDDAESNIDSRADEFIAKFYEQIKMQRQISYLHYN